jgi:teichuronic acid biosynthesis glycosyltransferase TuaC
VASESFYRSRINFSVFDDEEDDPVKILAITNMYPSLERPGSGVFVEQQIKGLLSRGMDVRVMFVDRRKEGASAYYRIAPMLQGELADFAPDLVHVMYGGVMADQVTKQRGLPPTVVTFHGSDLLGENLSGLARKLISHYGVHCSRKAARRSDGIIVVGRHLLKALGAEIAAAKVQVIPCGIDLERFKPLDQQQCRERLGWQPDDFHILFATSEGDPVKRPELARAAVGLLDGKYGHVKFHVLSGTPNSEVPYWLNAADVLLLTSKHEGSPTIVKEALACGLPVVSVPVGDVRERIAGIDGCHLAEPQPEHLARKLELVYKIRQRLNCDEKLQDISNQTIAARLEQFYLDILRRRHLSEARIAEDAIKSGRQHGVSSHRQRGLAHENARV